MIKLFFLKEINVKIQILIYIIKLLFFIYLLRKIIFSLKFKINNNYKKKFNYFSNNFLSIFIFNFN